MKVVVDTAREYGAPTMGVIPRFMTEVVHPVLDELIWTDTMSERKERLRSNAGIVVALPGGIGTLDELIETLTLAKLGLYDGRIAVVNVFGFYDKLKALLDHYVETGMMDRQTRERVHFVETVEAFEALL